MRRRLQPLNAGDNMNERACLNALVASIEGIDRVIQENGQDLAPRRVLVGRLWRRCPTLLDYIQQRCSEGWILVSITPSPSGGKPVIFERLTAPD